MLRGYNGLLLMTVFLLTSLISICCNKTDIDIELDNLESQLVVDENGVTYSCIWESNKHNAFTDLIVYRGRYYCVFREAIVHVPFSESLLENGILRIMSSEDCVKWKEEVIITHDWYDLRDPEFAINNEGDLLVYYGRHHWKENVKEKTGYVLFGIENNKLIIRDQGTIKMNPRYNTYWLWDVTQHNGLLYGFAYLNQKYPVLMQSNDGLAWSFVSEVKVEGGSEGALAFKNDVLYSVFRCDVCSNKSYCAMSTFPYEQWTITENDIRIESPEIINVLDTLYVCARLIVDDDMRLALFQFESTSNTISWIQNLISTRECGYPGMVYNNNNLTITYYSSRNTGLLPSVFCATLKEGIRDI